jgi:hypothetical protein
MDKLQKAISRKLDEGDIIYLPAHPSWGRKLFGSLFTNDPSRRCHGAAPHLLWRRETRGRGGVACAKLSMRDLGVGGIGRVKCSA